MHTDGSWPGSGIQNSTGELVQDLFGDRWSQLTWVLYLNDDFDGGHTTFFIPSADEMGVLESRPVQPRTGYATVFPHGECRVPLLHEGSSVSRGCKYLLRTEVIYSTQEPLEANSESQRLRGLARKLGIKPDAVIEDAATKVGSEGRKLKVKKTATKRYGKSREFSADDRVDKEFSGGAGNEKKKRNLQSSNNAGSARKRMDGKKGVRRGNTSKKNLHWR